MKFNEFIGKSTTNKPQLNENIQGVKSFFDGIFTSNLQDMGDTSLTEIIDVEIAKTKFKKNFGELNDSDQDKIFGLRNKIINELQKLNLSKKVLSEIKKIKV